MWGCTVEVTSILPVENVELHFPTDIFEHHTNWSHLYSQVICYINHNIYVIKATYHRGVLSCVVADDPAASWVSFGPLCDVVNLPINHQPLVVPVAVALHLLPGVDPPGSPAARLPCLRQMASTSHLGPPAHLSPSQSQTWHLDEETEVC